MRGRKPRQHRVALQEHVRRQPRVPIEGRQSRSVSIVPRGEGGNDDAGVDRQHQRRTLSKVARTRSSVRGGNSRSGTETRRPFRFSSRIGVAAGSISMTPSRSRISIGRPPDRPRASRIDFGMTTRPAASMVIRMAREYDRTLARLPPLAPGRPSRGWWPRSRRRGGGRGGRHRPRAGLPDDQVVAHRPRRDHDDVPATTTKCASRCGSWPRSDTPTP